MEAKLAENAPVKSDSVTFTAVLPVVTPEMSSVQGARPQEDEEAADASDKTKSAASEKSGKNEELPYQTQTEYTSAFGTADTPKRPRAAAFTRFRKAPVTWIFHSIRLVVLCGIDRTRARRFS